jgi:hypothetical protein
MNLASKFFQPRTLSFDAAYGQERVTAYLFLPASAQTVVFFARGGMFLPGSSHNADLTILDFIIKSGRALLFPVYKGTYERFVPASLEKGTSGERDLEVEDYKDLARSVDYIETRADLDQQKLAYYGVSQGAREAAVMLGLEKRLLRHLTSVLIPTSLVTPFGRSRPAADASRAMLHTSFRNVPFLPAIFRFCPIFVSPRKINKLQTKKGFDSYSHWL